MAEYRVNLDVYNGPLDLLLYLIRREEVDIQDIPVARITEQYIAYVDMLQTIDPDMAGEFLVLAATLLEIKTRMLLPAPSQEEVREGLAIDPRAELVRQLLQYKAFKDAAGELRDAADQRAMRFARSPAVPQADPSAVDLEDVQVWDLVEAFGKLLDSIGHRPTHHQVIYDDTPVELHQEDLLDRLAGEGPLRFSDIFAGRSRSEMVGLFLALLELVRLRKVFATQEAAFGEIHVYANPNPPAPRAEAANAPAIREEAGAGAAPAQQPREAPADPRTGASPPWHPAAQSPVPDPVEPASVPSPGPAPGPSPAGRYASDSTTANEREIADERATEDPGTGV